MPRFAHMLRTAFEARGHRVTMWSPRPVIHRFFAGRRYAKWAGYIDQYLLFPLFVRRARRQAPPDTLFVFADQALGPWVPLVAERPHVIHVHDLLALRSALGEIPENPTGLTGRLYQRFIRRGFRHGRHFISVSNSTRNDLHRVGLVSPAASSDMVYNGLNYPYEPLPAAAARALLREAGFPDAPHGFFLHVGGGQWYKNQAGVMAIYARYVLTAAEPLPLFCVAPPPAETVQAQMAKIGAKGRVHFFRGLENAQMQALYSAARGFLFPSLAEGFGWPLIEAQACGCPVVTTDAPPMNEVAGEAALLVPRRQPGEPMDDWAIHGAVALGRLQDEPDERRRQRVEQGLRWAGGFDAGRSIDQYLAIYGKVLYKQCKPVTSH